MIAAPPLADEEARLAVLAAYQILDTSREKSFDDLTELAAFICEAPIALISLVDESRQWFKSRIGIDESETARSISFCAHAIHSSELFVVPDATLDDRFADNPLVTNEPKIRFYAGAPLISTEGQALGTLCVIDRVPRKLLPDHAQALRILAHHVMTQLDLRRRTIELDQTKHEQRMQVVAMQAAEASERRYRLLFEKNPHSMWVYDTETLAFLAVNDTACDCYGYSLDEFLSMTIRDIRPATDVPMHEDPLRVQNEDGVREGTQQHVTKSGRNLTVDVTSHAIDWHGRPARLVLAVDVTDRFTIEQARARLAAAVDQAAEGIIITEIDGTISYVNPAFESITGYTPQDTLGKSPRILRSGRQDPSFYDQIWHKLANEGAWRGHVTNKKKDGSLYEAEMSISPIRNSEGRVINYVAVQRDVTREVELEAQLRHAQKLETVGQFAGSVAHDLNNILTIVQGNLAELLDGGERDPDERNRLLDIEAAAERAAKLTRQLLVFSRKDAIQLKYLDWNEIVRSLTSLLPRLLGETIRVSYHLDANVPLMRGDRGMMEQVLLNYVVNARDAMADGGELTIATSVEEVGVLDMPQHPDCTQPGTYVVVAVHDRGIGIAQENVRRIFEPFFTTKPVGRGTGLGLATVSDIVRQHQGWVEVQSQLGIGTTFRTYLPAVDAPSDVSSSISFGITLPTGTEGILVVEDDPTVLALVGRLLARLGYEVFLAGSGAAAHELFRSNLDRIDLLFTDLALPGGVSGWQLAKQLLSEKPTLKLLFTSGQGNVVGTDSAADVDTVCVRKPWSPHVLAEAVRAQLDRR